MIHSLITDLCQMAGQIFDHFVKKQHDNLRMNGYHEFHRETNMQKGIPLQIVSLWNSTLLAVQALIQHYYGDQFLAHCLATGWLTPISYVTTFNVAESLVLVVTHGCYIGKFILGDFIKTVVIYLLCR